MRRTLISALTLVTLAACNDSGDPTPTYINARVDGTYWSGPSAEGQVVHTVEEPAGPGIIVSIASIRVGAGSQVLSLGLVNPPALGNSTAAKKSITQGQFAILTPSVFILE